MRKDIIFFTTYVFVFFGVFYDVFDPLMNGNFKLFLINMIFPIIIILIMIGAKAAAKKLNYDE